MPGQIWLKTASALSDDHKSYRKFYNGIGTRPAVIISYSYGMNKFMQFLVKSKYIKNEHDFDKLSQFKPKQITEVLQDYVFHCNKRVKGVSTRSYLNGPELFFDMNDVLWNRRIVKKSIHRDDTPPGGGSAATNEDVYELINSCNNKLEIAFLHFLFSTGIRPGGIADPVLKMKHLQKMEMGCHAIKVYDESKEGYWSFLTPEAYKALENYLTWRTNKGENITPESPLFRANKKGKHDFLTAKAARAIVYKIIRRSSIKRIKTGNRYDKAVIYMFRKRFNGILKMDESNINSNIAEKLMAHNSKEIKLDTRYLDVPIEKLFAEFKKAIPELTVDPTERQRLEIEKKNEEINELQKSNEEGKEKDQRLERVEAILMAAVKSKLIPITDENKIIIDSFLQKHKS